MHHVDYTWTTLALLVSEKPNGLIACTQKNLEFGNSEERKKEKKKKEAQRDVTIPPSRCKLKWLADPRRRRIPVSPPR